MKSLHVFLIILALTVVFGSALTQKSDPDVLSEEISETNEPQTASPTPTITKEPQSSIAPTLKPSARPSPTAATITQETPMLIFPGAKIVSQNNDQTVLTVTADPSDVAKWYREKLSELGMRATASSQNNINGNFTAKIAAANGDVKYDIEITKASQESETRILLR